MHKNCCTIIVALFLVVLLFGCSGENQQEPAEETALELTDDITQYAVELWNSKITWMETWDLAPGTEELQENIGNPHGKFGTTVVNEIAKNAVDQSDSILPEGSIIVRKNFNDEKQLIRITSMVKKEDTWTWLVYTNDGAVEFAGELDNCIDCHKAALHDYVFFMNEMEGTDQTD